MQVIITIDCDHAAFGDMPGMEVSRILRKTCDEMRFGIPKDTILMDVNGNKVGKLEVKRFSIIGE